MNLSIINLIEYAESLVSKELIGFVKITYDEDGWQHIEIVKTYI